MRNKTLMIGVIGGIVIGVLLSTAVVFAGSLNPSTGPTGADSQMYTLQQIYDRLVSGAAGVKMTEFTEPTSGPGSTMRTLDEIMAAAPAVDATNGATVTQVLAGRTFWGLTASQWATQTGTMANNGAVTIMPTTTVQSIAAGYHDGSGTVAGDADLLAGNIRCGTTIFGVTGAIPEFVAKTGQTISYGTGDDGFYGKGGVPAVAPSGGFDFGEYDRTSFACSGGFTDNGNGTVTDNLTGLIWLKNANCFAIKNWTTALSSANTLTNTVCGLSDGSKAGDWRLPNLNELRSLLDRTLSAPYLPAGHPFTGVQSYYYWTSTIYAPNSSYAWFVYLYTSRVGATHDSETLYVWPVRGGQ